MQKEIHPLYFSKATVQCACGNSFAVGSTQEKIEIEICSRCHPFYSGEDKLLDAAGRVEKFKSKITQAKEKKETHQKIVKERTERSAKTKTNKKQ